MSYAIASPRRDQMLYDCRMPSFSAIALPSSLAKAIDVLGFREMTPVQAQTLPLLMQGRDVIVQAQTGSGKTAAFGLGLLSRLKIEQATVQALVLCPTRELADQVAAELRRLARFIPNVRIVTLVGGVPVRTQTPALAQPPHILVGTPGRILDHLRRKTIDLSALTALVIDEADRMLDMGFAEAMEEIVEALPQQRHTSLFSATYTKEIRAISEKFQSKATAVTVASAPQALLRQVFHEVEASRKFDALLAVLQEHRPVSALIFCHTRNDTREVAERLARAGFAACALHGELEQRERDEVLLQFAHQSCTLLVATDVAARGLDIKALPLVIAWELPLDPHVHIHRIGRTGRAGNEGLAVALCAPAERQRALAIEEAEGEKLDWRPLPPSTEPVTAYPPPMATFVIEAGRDSKLRAGDILGAFTQELGLPGQAIGKIDVTQVRAYVSIERARAQALSTALRMGANKIRIKGRAVRVFAM